MTEDEIKQVADKLLEELRHIPDPNMSNYRSILNEYRRMFNDVIVLIRESARNERDEQKA